MKEKLFLPLQKKLDLELPSEWLDTFQKIAKENLKNVLVAGPPDSGKSTFSHLLSEYLMEDVFILGADPGQPIEGVPGTLSLLKKGEGVVYYYFVGDITPARNVIDMLLGTVILSRRAGKRDERYLVIDTSGLISYPLGFKLKLAKTKLNMVDVVVGLYRDEDSRKMVSDLLNYVSFAVKKTFLLKASSEAKTFTREERARRREALFKSYFGGCSQFEFEVPLKKLDFTPLGFKPDISELENLLFSFDGKDLVSNGLGIVTALERLSSNKLKIRCLAKEMHSFYRLKFGNIKLNENAEVIGYLRENTR